MPEQDGAGRAEGVEGAGDVAPLVVAVRARLARRASVRPRVEGEDVVPLGHETLDDAEAGLPVVGDPVEVDDEPPALARGAEEPSLEARPLARERDGLVGKRRMSYEWPPDGMEDRRRAPVRRRPAAANERGRSRHEQAQHDERRNRQTSGSRGPEPHASLYRPFISTRGAGV